MRKPIHLLTIAVVAVALGSLTAAGYASAPAKPRLKVVSLSPFTVQGSHFKPHSHVRVTLTSGSQSVKSVTVNGQGRFRVTFANTTGDPCTQWTVKAMQRRHTLATVRGPRPECPVPTP